MPSKKILSKKRKLLSNGVAKPRTKTNSKGKGISIKINIGQPNTQQKQQPNILPTSYGAQGATFFQHPYNASPINTQQGTPALTEDKILDIFKKAGVPEIKPLEPTTITRRPTFELRNNIRDAVGLKSTKPLRISKQSGYETDDTGVSDVVGFGGIDYNFREFKNENANTEITTTPTLSSNMYQTVQNQGIFKPLEQTGLGEQLPKVDASPREMREAKEPAPMLTEDDKEILKWGYIHSHMQVPSSLKENEKKIVDQYRELIKTPEYNSYVKSGEYARLKSEVLDNIIIQNKPTKRRNPKSTF